MPFVLAMRCPETQQPIELAVFFNSREDYRSSTFEDSRVSCESCGQMHLLDEQRCWLVPVDSIPSSE